MFVWSAQRPVVIITNRSRLHTVCIMYYCTADTRIITSYYCCLSSRRPWSVHLGTNARSNSSARCSIRHRVMYVLLCAAFSMGLTSHDDDGNRTLYSGIDDVVITACVLVLLRANAALASLSSWQMHKTTISTTNTHTAPAPLINPKALCIRSPRALRLRFSHSAGVINECVL